MGTATQSLELDWNRLDTNPVPKLDIKLVLLLDNSSSMLSTWSTTISGVKEYLTSLKANKDDNISVTFKTFAHGLQTKLTEVPAEEVNVDLAVDKINANGASTALYDALGSTLNTLKDNNNPYLIVIFTDGQDNTSSEYDCDKLRDMITELEKQGNFTFVFMGAGPDSWSNANKLNINMANTAKFHKSETKAAWNDLMEATTCYTSMLRSTGAKSSINFYHTPNPMITPLDDDFGSNS